jgi:hypothetical protein
LFHPYSFPCCASVSFFYFDIPSESIHPSPVGFVVSFIPIFFFHHRFGFFKITLFTSSQINNLLQRTTFLLPSLLLTTSSPFIYFFLRKYLLLHMKRLTMIRSFVSPFFISSSVGDIFNYLLLQQQNNTLKNIYYR